MRVPDGLIVGVDLGGTRLAAGLVETGGRVVACTSVPTDRLGRGRLVVDNLVEVIGRLREEAGGLGRPVVGLGMGVPGVVDEATGQIGADIQNLPELRGFPLAREVAHRVGLPVALDNDVNALLLAECVFGSARGCRHAAMIAAGTGVGGALLLNGVLVRGASGYAGEIGHVSVDLEGRECFCGSRGCIKAYASGPDIAEQGRELFRRTPTPILAELCEGQPGRIDCERVLGAAARGDAIGLAVAAKTAQALGAGVATLINLCNPQMVFLAGGVLEAGDILMEPIRRWAKFYAFEGAFRAARILRSSLTKESGVQGGAALFLSTLPREAGERRSAG